MKRYIIMLLAVAFAAEAAAREVYSLNNEWKFFFRSENTSDAARAVTIPHTWNLDALSGSGTYRQTTGDYLRDLYVPSEWKDKRLFLRFYGVQSVADVFINGEHAGEHRGGFTAFTVEITDKVRYDYDNTLHVMVSNAFENDVLPLSTDMNLYGGIYRDVELIVTDKVVISPLYYGTDGVLVNQLSVSRESVEASVTLHLSGALSSPGALCSVSISVTGPDGYVAAKKSLRTKLDGKPVTLPFTIANPELWSPSDPRLYRVEAVAATDTVAVYTGFRNIEVTPGERFKINGRSIAVRGVALGHDRAPAGSALSDRDYAEDLDIACDMGANAIRSLGAPHAPVLYDMCDRRGVMVWIDFPLTQSPFPGDVAYIESPRLKENGRQQAHEIIAQNYNHPSVVMWGIFSMLRPRSDVMDYIRELNSIAKSADRSRPTVACSNRDGEINFITDLIVWQQSFGWSKGQISDLEIWQEALARDWSHLRQAVSYGESNIPSDYVSRNRENLPFAVLQMRFHEGYAEYLAYNDFFWGVWLNNLFDYGSTRHQSGVQEAGLVSLDHRQPKDIYYLYRALWNGSSPTVHLKGKNRLSRSRTQQTVRLYSSEPDPVLTINGDTVAVHKTGHASYVSDTVQMQGRRDIEVHAGQNSDRMTITIGNVLKHR